MLDELAQYPFARLDDWKAEAAASGVELIDFGMGDPREVTPAFIREALAASIEPVSSYPRATGLPELREAIAGWIDRRFGVSVDPASEIVPTLGSKEAIYSFAQLALGDKRARRDSRARLPGVRARCALRRRHGRDASAEGGARLAAGPRRVRRAGTRSRSSGSATRTTRRAPSLRSRSTRSSRRRAREHGFLLCSDEAYSELWFDEPPVSALQVEDRTNVVVFNTLSKRSSMTGYRSGFVCAPPEIGDALRSFRPTVGTAPQEFVQRASVAAWSDDSHVDDVRALYRRKRETVLPALEERGLRLAGSEATFYLWLDVGGPSEEFARRLLGHGIVVAPGSFFGAAGEGYVRLALVPTQEQCERAAAILREVL